ncbi:hypothetical protein EON79_17815 [bacterium]|nr:MAG: hypothetical protein EON79_17815 [bacterium]
MNETQTPPAEATLKTIVGIDSGRAYVPALRLLGRLRFKGNESILVHVESPIGIVYNPVPLAYDYGDEAAAERQARELGKTLLQQAQSDARDAGLEDDSKTIYAIGTSSGRLMDLADEENADLVAIGSRRQNSMESFFLGSVGRALAIAAHQSFLVARGKVDASGPVRAVFATDHSEYADRCFEKLLEMGAQGLGHVTVMTATEPAMGITYSGGVIPDGVASIQEGHMERGARLVARLAERGIQADFRLVPSAAETALRATMDETGSDLLILGARGHGLLERLLIGSLALHAVVAEPYSVLILRLPVEG